MYRSHQHNSPSSTKTNYILRISIHTGQKNGGKGGRPNRHFEEGEAVIWVGVKISPVSFPVTLYYQDLQQRNSCSHSPVWMAKAVSAAHILTHTHMHVRQLYKPCQGVSQCVHLGAVVAVCVTGARGLENNITN